MRTEQVGQIARASVPRMPLIHLRWHQTRIGKYRCVITDSNGTTVTSNIAKVENPSAPTVTGSQVQVVKADGTPYKNGLQ